MLDLNKQKETLLPQDVVDYIDKLEKDSAVIPELLEACKEALKALRIIYDNTSDEDVLARLDCWPLTELRQAIAKAEN